MLIDSTNGTQYFNASKSIADFAISSGRRFAEVDEIPQKMVTRAAETDDEGAAGETLEYPVFDETQITDEQFRAGFNELADVAENRTALLEIYKECNFYADEVKNLKIIEIRNEQQTAKNANFIYNGEAYYADADGREAIQGTLLIAVAKFIVNFGNLNETLKAELEREGTMQYMTAGGALKTFSFKDFVEFANEFFTQQQKITFEANEKIEELTNGES